MAITITYRFMGVDVPFNAANIDYIQWDSDIPAFDTTTSSVDVVWAGVSTHYYPFADGVHSPNVTYYTNIRMSVAHVGDGTVTNLVLHGINGDIYANGNTGVLVSLPPSGDSNPFGPVGGGITAGYGPLAADLQNVSTTVFGATAAMTPGNRGIVISVPGTGQWQIQKVAMRPRREEAE